MESLQEVTTRKILSKITRGEQKAKETLTRLAREAEVSHDTIAGVGSVLSDIHFVNGVKMKIKHRDGEELRMHDHALGQIAGRLKIPATYLKTLAADEEKSSLAIRILNQHLMWTDRERFLIRGVGDEVRGVLSDHYRRLSSPQIMEAFHVEVVNQGAVLCDAYFTDTRMYCEAIYPKPIIFPTAKNGDVSIAFGARLSTSDYGDGALDLRFFMMQGVCLNGMVRESLMRQVHLGSKLPSNLMMSEETYRLDTATSVSAIKDLTKGLFETDVIKRYMQEIQDAAEVEVDMKKELQRLIAGNSLTKMEGEGITEYLMNGTHKDGITGASTLWKLSQAVSAYGRDLPPKRERDLHEIAGALLNRVHSKKD